MDNSEKVLEKTIDNHNPFDNITEYRDYNSDYAEVVPQIDIPGCKIPFNPSKQERKKIRHFYNIAGGGIAIHYLVAAILGNVVYLLAIYFLKIRDGNLGDLPTNYSEIAQQYLNGSSITIGLTAIVYLLCNVAVFFFGSKISKIKIGSYFKTQNLNGSKIVRYIGVGIFLQIVSAYVALLIGYLTKGSGITDVTAEFYNGSNMHMILVTLLYTCIIAPITEEMLYRGFVMKNFARVSQRFGIFMSALFFGMAHGNVDQFVLAFILGIFLGYIVTKHNSLVPSIIVHTAVNTLFTVQSVIYSYNEGIGTIISVILTFAALIGGGIAFVMTIRKENLPFTTPHQKIRGGRIALTSFGTIAAFVVMFGMWLIVVNFT